MSPKELETFKRFIQSNNTFLSDLSSIKIPVPDIYIKTELLILYLKNKYRYDQILVGSQVIILDLLRGDFYIEDERIVTDEKAYSFNEVMQIVKSIKFENIEATPIKGNFKRYQGKEDGNGHCQIIDIGGMLRITDYTFKERGVIFERSCKVDGTTIPYVREMNRRFLELVERLFKDMLNDTMDIDDDLYYKVIASFLKIYPFVGYANGKKDIPFESLTLPLNEIGLTKVVYHDDYLDSIRVRIRDLNSLVKRLLHDTEVLISQGIITNKRLLEQRNQRVVKLNSDIASLILEYNEYSHNPDVLNRILFEYIYEAFSKGNVIINEYFLDPVLKFFTISNREVTSYVAIHLNTLIRVVDPELLSGEGTKKLDLNKNSQ